MMYPIRVAQVFHVMDRGGAENMIMNLYRKIDKSIIQFDFIVHTNKKGKFDEEIRSLGGNIYYFPRFRGLNLLQYYLFCKSFFKEHTEIKIVHGHLGSSAAIYLKAAKKNGIYTIAHSHSAGKGFGNLHDIFYRLFSFPTRFIADKLFGCSSEAGFARFGRCMKSNKYSNFPNAIDLNKFQFDASKGFDVRKEYYIPSDSIVICHIGRITKAKNPEKIFNVFKWLYENYSNVFCIWVGSGDLEDQISRRILDEKMSDRVIMTGVRNDVEKILFASDAFLFPSLWEGLPVSVIEAQASGIPCIISKNITKECEVSNLVTWLDVSDSDESWARICYEKAIFFRNNRISPVDDIRKSGYDIDVSVVDLCDFYLSCIKK